MYSTLPRFDLQSKTGDNPKALHWSPTMRGFVFEGLAIGSTKAAYANSNSDTVEFPD